MAKKSDSEFSRSRNFRELDEALKKSFTGIKSDMTALKENQHQQGVKLAELKQDVKDSKADFVTIDKFNILKIKIGELNENMKKVWDIDKKLEDLDRKSVSASEFDKHSVATENEIAKLKQDIDEIDKVVATEEQMKHLANDINDEFDRVKKGIEDLRSIKDSITRDELDKRTDRLNKRADDVRKDFDKLKAEVKTKVSATQAESLIEDINAEFDKLKGLVADMKKDQKKFALDADMIKQMDKLDSKIDGVAGALKSAMDDYSKGIESMFKDFAKSNDRKHTALSKETAKTEKKLLSRLSGLKIATSDQLNDLRSDMKLLVTKKQVENLVEDLNKEFDAVKDDSESNSKELARLSKDSATKKELAAAMGKLSRRLDDLEDDFSELKKGSATKEETHSLFDELRKRILETNQTMKGKLKELFQRTKNDLDDTNKSVKDNSADISAFQKSVKKELKSFATKDDLDDELDDIQDELDKLHSKLDKVHGNMLEKSELKDLNKRLKHTAAMSKKEFATKKQLDRMAAALDRLQEQVDDQAELLTYKNKELKAYAKELKAAKKAEKRLARYEERTAKSDRRASKKTKKPKKNKSKPFSKSSFLANFLIGAAFVILIAAIIFFFSGLAGITDILAISAVICFVIGIIIRIVLAFKNNK